MRAPAPASTKGAWGLNPGAHVPIFRSMAIIRSKPLDPSPRIRVFIPESSYPNLRIRVPVEPGFSEEGLASPGRAGRRWHVAAQQP